jgi:hypothetical protein
MKFVIESMNIPSGESVVWGFPVKSWFFIGDSGSSIKEIDSDKRVYVPEFDIIGSTRGEATREIMKKAAFLAEAAQADGKIMIGLRSDMSVLSSSSPTGYYVVCFLMMAYVPGNFAKETLRHDMWWLPQETVVDEAFWENLNNEDIVHEVMTS